MPDDLSTVADIAANLRAYIAEEAEKVAAPMIAAADKRIKEAEERHAFEIQVHDDLIAELRRQIKPLERNHAEWREMRAELAKIRARWPGLWNADGALRESEEVAW